MTPQKTIYITVYLLLLIPTLSIALITRIFSLKVMMLDGFSGNIIFLITCILCAVLYLIFKTTIDGYILPFLCKYSKIQLAVAESVTKKVTNQEPKQEANLPSYQEHYDAVAEKKRIEAEETLQRVLDYTMSELVHDMNESDMMTLCNYIREFQFGTASDIAQATTQRIRLTSDIKIIDLYHSWFLILGANIPSKMVKVYNLNIGSQSDALSYLGNISGRSKLELPDVIAKYHHIGFTHIVN